MAVPQDELKRKQEEAQRREAERNANQAALFSSALASPQQPREENPLEITTKESDLLSVFNDQEFLQENNLKFTPDEEGQGGKLTPADTKDGDTPSYSVHFAPNTSGGFTATITGDIDKGLDAAFKTLQAAGIKETVISGKKIETDEVGYKVMKQALEHKITPVLEYKGVYESVALFAKQGEKDNPEKNKETTEQYLKSIVDNDKLRPQLVDDMVKAGLVKEDNRNTVTNGELIEKGLKDVMSKAKADVEDKVKISPANASNEARKSPSAPQDSSGLLGAASKIKMEPKPTSSPGIDDEATKGNSAFSLTT